MNNLVKLTAREAVSQLKKGTVSPLELIDAALQRIDETGDAVNALPTVCADRARDHAARLPDLDESDTPRGYLHGLPIAIKDLKDVAGVRSTRGSPIFAEHVPDKSDLLVTNLEDKGGSSSPRPTPPSSAPAPTPSTKSSARRATPGTPPRPAAAHPAAPPPRSPPARYGSPPAATSAAASESRPASAPS